MKLHPPLALALGAGLFLLPAPFAHAASSVTPGNTFSVASQSGLPLVGTHFHSDHAGALGKPPDKAEVGSLQDQALSMEQIRGLSEFNLAGLTPGTASLQFRVDQLGGLFAGQNDKTFSGTIGILAYSGNNADDISDYSIAPLAPITTFPTTGLALGDVLTFDVTSIYNAQLLAAAPSLGFRLQTTPSTITAGGAFTFDTFTLTVTSESEPEYIPEPASLALLLAGTLAVVARRRL